MDARVQDCLDDRLQNTADLDSLDSLLENVKSQQDLLKKQVRIVMNGMPTLTNITDSLKMHDANTPKPNVQQRSRSLIFDLKRMPSKMSKGISIDAFLL